MHSRQAVGRAFLAASRPLGALWHSLAISSWSSIPFLGAIRAPTLVVCGSRDRMVPPANSTLLARRIPDAELVMLSAGHDLQRRGRGGRSRRTGDGVPDYRTCPRGAAVDR